MNALEKLISSIEIAGNFADEWLNEIPPNEEILEWNPQLVTDAANLVKNIQIEYDNDMPGKILEAALKIGFNNIDFLKVSRSEVEYKLRAGNLHGAMMHVYICAEQAGIGSSLISTVSPSDPRVDAKLDEVLALLYAADIRARELEEAKKKNDQNPLTKVNFGMFGFSTSVDNLRKFIKHAISIARSKDEIKADYLSNVIGYARELSSSIRSYVSNEGVKFSKKIRNASIEIEISINSAWRNSIQIIKYAVEDLQNINSGQNLWAERLEAYEIGNVDVTGLGKDMNRVEQTIFNSSIEAVRLNDRLSEVKFSHITRFINTDTRYDSESAVFYIDFLRKTISKNSLIDEKYKYIRFRSNITIEQFRLMRRFGFDQSLAYKFDLTDYGGKL